MSSTRPLPLEAVLIRSFQLIQAFGLSTALVRNWSSLVLEQDVERGERSITARDVLLQVELACFAQFTWHAVASAKAGRSRSPSV